MLKYLFLGNEVALAMVNSLINVVLYLVGIMECLVVLMRRKG